MNLKFHITTICWIVNMGWIFMMQTNFKALSGHGIFHYPVKIKYKGLKTPLIIHLYGQIIN